MLADDLFECVLAVGEILLEGLLDGLFELGRLGGTVEQKRTPMPRPAWWLPERTHAESHNLRGSTERAKNSAHIPSDTP